MQTAALAGDGTSLLVVDDGRAGTAVVNAKRAVVAADPVRAGRHQGQGAVGQGHFQGQRDEVFFSPELESTSGAGKSFRVQMDWNPMTETMAGWSKAR